MSDKACDKENSATPSTPYNKARMIVSQVGPSQEEQASPPPAAQPPAAQPAAGVLGVDKYSSMNDLKEELLALGPNNEEAYERIKRSVKEEDQDSALEALTKFFQGSPQALCFIYDRMVEAGNAEPIDSEIVERVMEKLPQSKQENKTAGLFIPKVEKRADRMSEPYLMSGCSDNRFCPKTRNLVSTYICRFHCLDGLAVDDAQIVCGEAIWRQAVMDKFSREYKDKDGKWKGGYLRKRFIIQQDEIGRPYQLKPGHRNAPIHEDAWSTEKRIQEMRRSEGNKRGYSPTPGDPKNLYNFDPHEALKSADSKELAEKKRDPIAKNASKAFNLKKAGYEGDHSVAPDVTVNKKCVNCGFMNSKTATFCTKCKQTKFVETTQVEQEVASGAVSNPEFMPSIKASNGVFMAVQGGKVAFGDTENQAMSRLAADEEGPTVEEEGQALMQMREMDDEGIFPEEVGLPEEMQTPEEVLPSAEGVEQVQGDPVSNTSDGEGVPLPPPLEGEEPGEVEGELDPSDPLDAGMIQSQENAQKAESQGPQAYMESPDFTPGDALEEGEGLGLGEDQPEQQTP